MTCKVLTPELYLSEVRFRVLRLAFGFFFLVFATCKYYVVLKRYSYLFLFYNTELMIVNNFVTITSRVDKQEIID